MIRTHVVLVLLCALLPLHALGQDSLPPAPPLVSGEPMGMTPGESAEARELWLLEQSATRKRMTVEALAGVLLGAAGAVPGVLMMANSWLCNPFASRCNTARYDPFFSGMALGAVGYSLGAMLGIFVGGSLMGGEGGLLPAVGGTLAGGLVGAVLAVVSIPVTALVGLYVTIVAGRDSILDGTFSIAVPVVMSALLVAAPLVGGIGFYEGAHRKAVERKKAVQVLPLVSVSPRGGLVAGLAARF